MFVDVLTNLAALCSLYHAERVGGWEREREKEKEKERGRGRERHRGSEGARERGRERGSEGARERGRDIYIYIWTYIKVC